MRQRILDDIIKSMKEKNKDKLAVLRSVKGAMQLEEINKKKELNDEDVIGVVAKQIKLRKDSIVEFEKGNRQDLIDQANKEIDILNEYMPEQLSDEDVNAIIDAAFNELNPTQPSDMGKVMGYLTPKLKGKTDLGLVSKKVRERIIAK
jgi:uncharacterized protein YqeY